MKFRNRYSQKTHKGLKFSDPSLTKQSFKDEADINKIMKRALKTGFLEQASGNALYGDFSEAPDYLQAITTVMHAQQQFDSLPANIRREFDNNPANFLEFAHNPANLKQMREMGLAKPEEIVNLPPKQTDQTESGKSVAGQSAE